MAKLAEMLAAKPTIYQGIRESEPVIATVREWLEHVPDDPALQVAVALHTALRAVEEGGKGAKSARKALNQALERVPDHPLLLSLRALLPALEANATLNPVGKYADAKKAMKGLDAVVERFPDFYAAHAMRGQAFAMMPDAVLGTHETALADLAWMRAAWMDRMIYVNRKTYLDSMLLMAREYMRMEDREVVADLLLELYSLAHGTPDEAAVRELAGGAFANLLKEIPHHEAVLELPKSMRKARKRLAKAAGNKPDASTLKRLGIVEYFAGLGGEPGAVFDSIEHLAAAQNDTPEDPVVLTMLGCAWVLSGDESHYSSESYARVAVGLQYLRLAALHDTNNYVLRWLRTATYLGIPADLFLTHEQSRENYEWLVSANPERADLEQAIEAIFEQEDWFVDAHNFYIAAIRTGLRFYPETRVPFLTGPVVAQLGTPAQRLEVVQYLVGIVKRFSREVPETLGAY